MEEDKSKYKYPVSEAESIFTSNPIKSKKENKGWTLVHCPQCDHPTPASNLDLEKLLAKCDSCNAVFPFKVDLDQINTNNLPSEVVDMPDGIAEMDYGYGKELWCKLKPSSSFYALAFLAAFFAVFCFGFLYWTRTSDKGPILFFDIMFSIFGLLGIYGMIDCLLKGSRNTKIKIDDYRLTIDHPGLRKNTIVNLEDVEKIYLEELKTADLDGHQKSIYNIRYTTKGGDEQKLFKNLALKSQAKYIEQEINKYIRI